MVASLGFLGLGAQPPTPEWGTMLSEGQGLLRDCPWMIVFPGLMIMITVVAFNFIGDGLRDVFDPQHTMIK
jgi:peptide/nickel transport system permease protein